MISIHTSLLMVEGHPPFISTWMETPQSYGPAQCNGPQLSVGLLLDGSEIGNAGPLRENGAMHRDSHRGMWFAHTFRIPAARLLVGETVLLFRLKGTSWDQGMLYNFIWMKAVAPPGPAS